MVEYSAYIRTVRGSNPCGCTILGISVMEAHNTLDVVVGVRVSYPQPLYGRDSCGITWARVDRLVRTLWIGSNPIPVRDIEDVV